MPTACLICTSEMKPVFEKNEVPVMDCPDCHYRAAGISVCDSHTESLYGDDYFFEGGDGYTDYLDDGHVLEARGRWYGRLLRKHGVPSGRLLDVGAAAGFLASGFQTEGFEAEGLEPNHTMVQFGRQDLGLQMHHGTLENFDLAPTFEVISMVQVLAHLTDPAEAFRRAAQLTLPGGHWLIETWNYKSMSARFFGKSWHQYSPPRTLHWFTPSSLECLAAKFGMQKIASGRPDKSITAGHAKSLLKHATADSSFLKIATSPAALIPDRVKIPYLADDVKWYLFQKNDC